MNTKLGLAAITMFAVIMGMSAIVPAIAEPGNEKSNATTEICHFAETEFLTDPDTGEVIIDPDTGEPIVVEEAHWMFLFVSGKGALNGHIGNHGDGTQTDFEIVDDDTRQQCQNLVDATASP